MGARPWGPHVHSDMKTRIQQGVSFTDTPSISFETRSLIGRELTIRLDWLASVPRVLSVSIPSTGVTRACHHSWLLSRGFLGSNTGPHTCEQALLSEQSSLQSQALELGKGRVYFEKFKELTAFCL